MLALSADAFLLSVPLSTWPVPMWGSPRGAAFLLTGLSRLTQCGVGVIHGRSVGAQYVYPVGTDHI